MSDGYLLSQGAEADAGFDAADGLLALPAGNGLL